MKSIITIYQDAMCDFGNYLSENPDSKQYPDYLVKKYKDRLFNYWQENFLSEKSKWDKSSFKGLFFGTLVGADIGLYIHRFGALFDHLFFKEPLSKVLMLAPYKTPIGLYNELTYYLNVFMDIEEWIEKEIVYLYPQFFLANNEYRTQIRKLAAQYYTDSTFKEMALTCPDRVFKYKEMMHFYKNLFSGIFDPFYIDLWGGIQLFTEDYLVRTMAQDIAAAQFFSKELNAIPITCVERHLQLYRYTSGKITETVSINMPADLERYDSLLLRDQEDYIQVRKYLNDKIYHKTQDNMNFTKDFNQCDSILYYYSNAKESSVCLKVPFLSRFGLVG